MKQMSPLACFFRSHRTWFAYLASAVVVLGLTQAPVHAAIIYATELNNGGGEIVKVDTTTNTVTLVTNAVSGSGPDSLIFSGSNIIYSNVFSGQITLFNGSTNTVIASGLSIPQDLVLDPGGSTFLFSDTGNGRIIRESVTGGPLTVLATGGNPTGMAYDAAGHLFVVRGNALDQIDPITGAVIKGITLSVSGDGLTYDPFSGNLFMSFVGGIVKVPTDLSGSTVITTGNGDRIDGLEADGLGNLFLADTTAERIVEWNGSTFTNLTSVPTIDDLAPVVGGGSPTVPEPASITLLGLGIAGLMGYTWRRKSA